MTTTTQERILARLAKMAKQTGGELVIDSKWANTGKLSIVMPDEITSPTRLAYSFQDDYVSFGGMVVDQHVVLIPRYDRPAEVTEALQTLTTVLAHRDKGKKR